MSAAATPAVLYAAKSTEDRHGSIPTQLVDGRALAEREGLAVAGEYHDEAASAYHGNRGPGLARAKAHAERIGAALIVQHSDRLARGDGASAEHLVELVLWARKAGVTIRSVQDPQTFDSMGLVYAALMGDRNHEDSARKSAATRDGLKRRKDRGAPVGAVPLGYRVEHFVVEGKPMTRRVVDERGAALYDRMVCDAERGLTPGAIGRALNTEGQRTARGGVWSTRAVRSVLRNDDYLGGNGYPALITRERWDALQARLGRMDPVAVAARKGGRPANEDAVLAGVAFCGRCGERMYMRRAAPASRHYRCRHAMEGACDAPSVRADVAEAHVLMHLTTVVGEQLHAWLRERAVEHAAQRDALAAAAERERARLRGLERTLARAAEQHRRLLADDPQLADTALRQVAALDADVQAAELAVGDAEARAAEFADAPDQRAAFDHLTHLAALVGGRLKDAKDGAAINGVLRAALEGVWLRIEDGVLHADMRASSGVSAQIEGDPQKVMDEGWATVSGPPEWLVQTERQTFVYDHPVSALISL